MTRPRATSEPRTLKTYSCESRSISSWIRTGGITMPSSPAIWRRIIETRRTSVPPPLRRSTSGTRPKPMPSSSGSIGSSLSTVSWATARRPVGSRQRGRRGGVFDLIREPVTDRPSGRPNIPPMNRNGIFGRPGTSANGGDHAAGHDRRLLLAEDLRGDVGTEVALGRRARDDDAGGHRDQQRRDLRDQTVADGQQRVTAASPRRRTGRAARRRRRYRRRG